MGSYCWLSHWNALLRSETVGECCWLHSNMREASCDVKTYMLTPGCMNTELCVCYSNEVNCARVTCCHDSVFVLVICGLWAVQSFSLTNVFVAAALSLEEAENLFNDVWSPLTTGRRQETEDRSYFQCRLLCQLFWDSVLVLTLKVKVNHKNKRLRFVCWLLHRQELKFCAVKLFFFHFVWRFNK